MRTITLLVVIALAGCSKAVLRDPVTYQTEVMASLLRQTEAATALRHAAEAAPTIEDCIRYAEPALLIDAAAKPQAYRALWLAGLAYPSEGAEDPQPDPGPSPEPAPATTICAEGK